MICMSKPILYCQLMYLRTLETCVLKHMNLILQHFSAPGLIWQAALKKTKIKLDLLIDIDVLLEEEYVTLFFDMQKLITNT